MKIERCSLCGKGEARETTGIRKVRVEGKVWRLRGDRFMYCPRCHKRYYSGEQARESSERLKALRHGEQTYQFPSRRIDLGPLAWDRFSIGRPTVEQTQPNQIHS